MRKKYLYQLLIIFTVALLSIGFASCGGDDDDEDEVSGGSNAKVSLSLSGAGTSYTATVTVSGANAADVVVLGVRVQPQATTGYKPGKYYEAGSRTTRGTCKFTLEKGNTYFINAYANINGTRLESEKQTKRIR